MRILVVDDDYVSRVKLKSLLVSHGDCDGAPNGELAFAMIKAAKAENTPYELITMDIDLPDIDGKELVKSIREWEATEGGQAKPAKIIMISKMVDGGNIFSSFSKGAEFYLRKPVTPKNLQEAMEKIQQAADLW